MSSLVNAGEESALAQVAPSLETRWGNTMCPGHWLNTLAYMCSRLSCSMIAPGFM